jgi:hypothetical protein
MKLIFILSMSLTQVVIGFLKKLQEIVAVICTKKSKTKNFNLRYGKENCATIY